MSRMVVSVISSFCVRVAGKGCATAALPRLFTTASQPPASAGVILASGEWQRSLGGKVPRRVRFFLAMLLICNVSADRPTIRGVQIKLHTTGQIGGLMRLLYFVVSPSMVVSSMAFDWGGLDILLRVEL